MSSIMIAEYLDENEAPILRERLKAEGIDPIVKRHGLPRMFGVDSNYRIFIERPLADKGKIIVERFLAERRQKRAEARELLTKQCPGCLSKGVENIPKISLWQRIRFYGVSVWQCRECGGRWYT